MLDLQKHIGSWCRVVFTLNKLAHERDVLTQHDAACRELRAGARPDLETLHKHRSETHACLPKASTMDTPTWLPSLRAFSAARFRAPVLA